MLTKREQILDLLSQGESINHIVEKVGCDIRYVQKLKRDPEFGTHSRRPKKVTSPRLIPLSSVPSQNSDKELLIALIGSPKQVLEAIRDLQ